MKPLLLRSSALVAIAMALGAGCSSKSSSDNKSTFLCSTAADCDGLTGSEGYICLGSQCTTCSADWQCSQVPHYGSGARCVSGRCAIDQTAVTQQQQCVAGIESCACQVDGSCQRGLVCDASAKTCRQPKTCADVQCAGGQACIPCSDGKDAACAGNCQNGQTWDATAQACTQHGANCAPNDPSSLLDSCAQQGRTCETTNSNSAGCGQCRDSYVATGTACLPRVHCAELNCAASHQLCADDPNGHCTDCLQNYVADAAGAHCLATCAALQCQNGQECVEHTANTAAMCVMAASGTCPKVPTCGDNEAWNPMWRACQDCGNLACIEDDRHTGHIFPVVTNQFRCVCETKPGFYFDSATLQAEPCDADGDGWVRRSAWDALSRRTDCAVLGDPNCDCALHDNARCQVRTIDRFVLEDIYGEREDVLLSDDDLTKYTVQDGLLALYETDTNDDLSLRDPKSALPAYASGAADKTAARQLRASEVNSLTKACVDAAADFNGNQQSDITEYQGTATIPGPEWLLPFAHFSYFIELYDAWYEPNATNEQLPGSYHIREKARRSDEGSGSLMPFFAAQAADYSQTCHRFRDKDYVAVPSKAKPDIGMDFARFDQPNAVARFGHHSQFKCVQVMSNDAVFNARQAPQQVRLSDAPSLYDFESCSLGPNAELSGMQCASTATPTAGMVGFGKVKYRQYATTGGYTRGCINECAEETTLLATPGINLQICPTDGHWGCKGNDGNYGQYVCGCKDNAYKGDHCEIACTNWYLDADGDDYYDASTMSQVQCKAPDGRKWHEAPVSFDCNDANKDIHPGVTEVCNGVDDNCDGNTDEGLSVDADGDGHYAIGSCFTPADDCNDANAAIHPGAQEVCDGIDNNCSGVIDEGFETIGSNCEGNGVCWNRSSWHCASDKVSPSVCVPLPEAPQGPHGQTGTGKNGPTWDWDCDGGVTLVDSPPFVDPRDQQSFEASRTTAKVKVCLTSGSYLYGFRDEEYYDYNTFCNDIGFPKNQNYTPGELAAAYERCVSPHYVFVPQIIVVTGSQYCGNVYRSINCQVSPYGFCTPAGVEVLDNMPCVCKPRDDGGTECQHCAYPMDTCTCSNPSCDNCATTMCYCASEPPSGRLCTSEGVVEDYNQELVDKGGTVTNDPLRCE